jgi:hypothetical protein
MLQQSLGADISIAEIKLCMISNALVNMRVSPPPAERLFGHRSLVTRLLVTSKLTLATPSVICVFI